MLVVEKPENDDAEAPDRLTHEQLATDSIQSDCPDETDKSKNKPPNVSIIQLFRFATAYELLLILVACVCSAGAGALLPLSVLIFGLVVNTLTSSLEDTSSLLDQTMPIIHISIIMGCVALITGYISNCLWVLTGEHQTKRIRALFLHSVLKQDMSWFDAAEDGSLNTRLASDTQLIQDGVSEKFGQFVSLFAQFIAGFIVSFIKGWRLSLVILAIFPLLFGSTMSMDVLINKYSTKAQQLYAEAGSISEQAFYSIRTVYAFTLQNRFSRRYSQKLEEACRFGTKRGIVTGAGFAIYMFVLFSAFSLSLWYGAKLVVDGLMTGPEVFVVFTAMMTGCFAFVRLPPNLNAISSARGAAFKVYEIIDRTPQINTEGGLSPTYMRGSIEFRNVTFKYPTRLDLTVLDNLSLKIGPGMSVAFVGPSGSGKSTSVQLIQRFYDTLSGEVLLDGINVKDLNVNWLRQQIGVVSQEPVLFNMTIRQNLLMGTRDKVSDEQIISACKEANCHAFISQLPHGYDTIVGELGGMLSGGQKQRIAIARAILKNPAILLLDEATSALDTQSERLVQEALNKASASRTTIVVAHRLSTIKNSDLIVVLDNGKIIEQGTHEELIVHQGIYAKLVEKQAIDVGDHDQSESPESEEFDTDVLLKQEQFQVQRQIEKQEKNTMHPVFTNQSDDTPHDTKLEKEKDDIDAYELRRQGEKKLHQEMSKQKAPIWKVFKSMKNEWGYLFAGIIAAAVAGCIWPVYSLIFSYLITTLSTPGNDLNFGPMEGTNLYAFLFFVIAIVAFICFGAQFYFFEVCGERFTKRLRIQVFNAYLKQEVGFFDREENSTGELTTKLSVDARRVNDMITKIWGDVAQVATNILSGVIISMVYSWKLTLIILCISPFLSIAAVYEDHIQGEYEDKTAKTTSSRGQIAGEAIREVRTIASLNKQSYFEEKYAKASERPHQLAIRKAYLSSIAAGISKSAEIFATTIGFYAGTRFIMDGSITFLQMYTCMNVMLPAAEAAGRCTTFIATFTKAKFAAIASYNIIERQPEIDSELEGIEPKNVNGDIDFKNVKFAYPSRPEISVFDGNFNLIGKSGQTIALVGPSGCGKSTAIGLLQRWYDPLQGVVTLDKANVKSYSIHNLRSHMALVGQEPVLFDMTIGENIRYGIADGVEVSQEQLEQACKSANIHKFVESLPNKYETRVGDKGSQLSGGQKQRVAIARALIRKPEVLLLDEATSALDSESERLVQDALDNIIKEGGRTTITIAHRLSTIKNADLIYVVGSGGTIIEQGTHFELLALKGVYSKMVNQQSLSIFLKN